MSPFPHSFSLNLFFIIFYCNFIKFSISSSPFLKSFIQQIVNGSHPVLSNCSWAIIMAGEIKEPQIQLQLTGLTTESMLLSTNSFNVTNLSLKNNGHRYRRHRGYCTIGFIPIGENFGDGIETYKLIKFILKKDEDFFIFSSAKESSLENLVSSSSPLILGIKHRIALIASGDETKPKAFRICFYCSSSAGNGGKTSPFISSIQIKNSKNNDWDWSPLLQELLRDQMKDFEGKEMRMSTPNSTRWLNEMYPMLSNGRTWLPKRGPYMLVLNLLQKQMNFTVSYLLSSSGGGTGAFVNGTWIGTVGDVLYGIADLGHVTAQTASRHSVVESSVPISYEWLTFSTGSPKPFFTWRSIYFPLSPGVWTLVIISLFVAILVFYFLLCAQLKDSSITGTRSILSLVVQYVYGTMVEQDIRTPDTEIRLTYRKEPFGALRSFTIIWLLYTLLIGTAYRSKLVTFLAFPNFEPPPGSFEELADRLDYDIGLQYIKGAAYAVLKRSKNPTYMKIFRRMSLESSDVDCFLKTLQTQRFACISWDSIAEFVKHRNLTDATGRSPVLKSKSSTLAISAGLVMEKRAIFRKNIDSILRWITDTGILLQIREEDFRSIRESRTKWLRETNQTRNLNFIQTQNAQALTLSHVLGCFYILSLGFSLSIAIMLIEHAIIFRKHHRPTSKQLAENPEGSFEFRIIKMYCK